MKYEELNIPASVLAGNMIHDTVEKDPYGTSASTPGAKLDAGKQRPWLVLARGFGRALKAVTRIGTMGAIKYSPDGWKSVPDAFDRYMDAFQRHYDEILEGRWFDTPTGEYMAVMTEEQEERFTGQSHLVCMVWNLLAAEEHRMARDAGYADVATWHKRMFNDFQPAGLRD